MKKIPSVFKRGYEGTRQALDEITPSCEWVLEGEGEATEKLDGTACAWLDGKPHKRYDRKVKKSIKKRKKKGPYNLEDFKDAPEGFIACEPEPNLHTGHWPGWVPIGGGPEDEPNREAFDRASMGPANNGQTFELMGPKVQGNSMNLAAHLLVPHGGTFHTKAPRDFKGLREYLYFTEIEGLVFYHPDGRRAKVKRKDFGWSWPPTGEDGPLYEKPPRDVIAFETASAAGDGVRDAATGLFLGYIGSAVMGEQRLELAPDMKPRARDLPLVNVVKIERDGEDEISPEATPTESPQPASSPPETPAPDPSESS